MDILHIIIHNLARFVKFFTQLSRKLYRKPSHRVIESENRNGLEENLREGLAKFTIV